MGGSGTLGDNLLDDLVPVVDELRTDLYEDMGVRQHDVYLVRRAWSGPKREQGVVLTTTESLMTPPPLFEDMTESELGPGGREERGSAKLTEVSLTYTEDELTGGDIGPNEEFFYKVSDHLGQGIRVGYFFPVGAPVTDRSSDLGWTVSLRRIEISES